MTTDNAFASIEVSCRTKNEVNVTVSSTGGDIDIENARGAVSANTLGGDVNVGLAGADSSTDRSSHLKSTGDEVTIYLPENLAVTIDAEIKIGSSGFWKHGDYRVYPEFNLSENNDGGPERNWAWVSGRTGCARVKGDINGGGDLIRIETTYGNIEIRKR